MKFAKYFILFASALWLVSGCKPMAGGGEIDLKVGGSVLVLDTTKTSCAATTYNNVPAQSFQINEFKFSNTLSTDLYIEYIRITMSNPDFPDKVYTVSGDELNCSWRNYLTNARVKIPAGTVDSVNRSAVALGGIKLKDPTRPAFGSGRIYIYATTTDGNGDTRPVTGYAYFNWSNGIQ